MLCDLGRDDGRPASERLDNGESPACRPTNHESRLDDATLRAVAHTAAGRARVRIFIETWPDPAPAPGLALRVPRRRMLDELGLPPVAPEAE